MCVNNLHDHNQPFQRSSQFSGFSIHCILVGFWLLSSLVSLDAATGSHPVDKPLPDEKTFIEEALQKIKRWECAPLLPVYREHRVSTDFDGDKVAGVLDEIYSISWYRGKPVYVQEKRNGIVNPPEHLKHQAAEKQKSIDEELARPSDKEKIEAVYLTPLLNRFSYRIVGREIIDGRPAIKIRVEPIPGRFTEHKIAMKILEKTAGYIWIDEEEKEFTRAEVGNISTINIGWGIVGSISLLQAEYHRDRFPGGQWFVTYLKIRAKVRIFFFTKYNRKVESNYYNIAFPNPIATVSSIPAKPF